MPHIVNVQRKTSLETIAAMIMIGANINSGATAPPLSYDTSDRMGAARPEMAIQTTRHNRATGMGSLTRDSNAPHDVLVCRGNPPVKTNKNDTA